MRKESGAVRDVHDVHDRALRAWPRACTHYAKGIDTLCLQKEHEMGRADGMANGNAVTRATLQMEYKWSLPHDYDHPLSNTDVILVWSLDGVEPGRLTIVDKQECEGTVEHCDELAAFGYRISRVKDGDQTVMSRTDLSRRHVVDVLSLRDLIIHTFSPFCRVQFCDAENKPLRKRQR